MLAHYFYNQFSDGNRLISVALISDWVSTILLGDRLTTQTSTSVCYCGTHN